jgi:hypothetical protein
VTALPPSLSTWRTEGDSGWREKTTARADADSRIAKVLGSSPLSTTQPSGRTTRVMTALTSASWSTVSTPCSPRWSALTLVTTETSVCVTPIPRSRMPPRAVSVTASCTRGSSSTVAAPLGPE